jgi:transcriptional regulator with XRE-family HTH domain
MEKAKRQRVLFTPMKAARLRLGITQAELAERVGLSMTHVSNMERAPGLMLPDVAKRIAAALAVNVDELLKGSAP